MLICSNIIVLRLEISRTYDDVADYSYANWKYDPYMVIGVRRFLELNSFEYDGSKNN